MVSRRLVLCALVLATLTSPAATSAAEPPVAPPSPTAPPVATVGQVGRESVLKDPGAFDPGPDLDALLAQIAAAMRTSMVESRNASITTTIEARKTALLAATAAKERAMIDAANALQNGIELKLQALAGASVSMVASTLAVSTRTSAGKLATTKVALPTDVFPVDAKGVTTAQIGMPSKAWDAVARALGGNLVGVSLVVKPATLPEAAIPEGEQARLAELLRTVEEQTKRMTDLVARLRAEARVATPSMPGAAQTRGRVAAASPAAKRRHRARVRRLRRQIRAASRSRDRASHAADVLTVRDFSAAGSRDAPVSSFAIERCVKGVCPFAVGG